MVRRIVGRRSEERRRGLEAPDFTMRVVCVAVLLTALVFATAAKQRARKFDGDFEFAEEVRHDTTAHLRSN